MTDTTILTAIFVFIVTLVPGMSLGMAIMGLHLSKFWSIVIAVATALCCAWFLPHWLMLIPVGYMFLGICYAWNDPDLLQSLFSFSSSRAARRGRWW